MLVVGRTNIILQYLKKLKITRHQDISKTVFLIYNALVYIRQTHNIKSHLTIQFQKYKKQNFYFQVCYCILQQ